MSLSGYVKAAIPDHCVVMGVVLRPFSPGHYLLLARNGSPFIADVLKEINLRSIIHSKKQYDAEFFAHLIFALCICSHDDESNIEMLSDPKLLRQEIERTNKAIKKSTKYAKRNGGFNLLEKLSMFREYLQDAHKVPAWSFNNSSGAKSGVSSKHWIEQLIEDLISKGNRSRSEVKNMPLAEAWLAWAYIAEDQGAITLLSEQQEQTIKNKTPTLTIEDPKGWEKLLNAYEAEHGKQV